jgi:hypothetical protein
MVSNLTPEKCISISKGGILLGRKVSEYFKSRGTILVNIILNYNNNSMIITDTGLRENFVRSHTDPGLRVRYETSYKHNTDIRLTHIIKFFNLDYINVFKAKPFKGTSVIVENLPLKSEATFRGYIVYVNIKSRLVLFGNLKQCLDIKLEDITPSEVSDETITKNSAQTINTPSSSQIKPKPIQKNVTNHIPDKEYANNDIQKKPEENRPSPEALEQADREYSRMILGE